MVSTSLWMIWQTGSDVSFHGAKCTYGILYPVVEKDIIWMNSKVLGDILNKHELAPPPPSLQKIVDIIYLLSSLLDFSSLYLFIYMYNDKFLIFFNFFCLFSHSALLLVYSCRVLFIIIF